MGQRGPAPKPTKLRILEGGHKERINRAEPKPNDGPLVAPDWLSEGGAERFYRLAPELRERAGAAWWDSDAFAVYCDLIEDYANGNRERRARIAPTIRQYAREFGLTPSARSGIRVGEARSKSGAERLLS